jgi:hypothetical protein
VIEQFRRDGFVIAPVFEPRELLAFADTLAEAELGFTSDGEMYDCLAATPQFLRLASKCDVSEIVNELLGRDLAASLYGLNLRCRIDRPGATFRRYGWHQEIFYTAPHARLVQIWAPLVADATPENGTLIVCPGSHARLAPHRWVAPVVPGAPPKDAREDSLARETSGHQGEFVVDDIAGFTPQAVPVRLGDALFLHPLLLHRSGDNRTDRTRYTMIGKYHDPFAAGFRVPMPDLVWRGKTPMEHYHELMEVLA